MTNRRNPTPRRGTLRVAALGLALLVGVPGVASAQTTDTRPPADKSTEDRQPAGSRDGEWDMSEAKERAKQAIDVRVAALDRTIVRLNEAELVTPDHKERLVRELEAVKASLLDLRRRIEAEEDPRQLKALMQQIVSEHYVFAFQIPRARLVAGSDVVVGISVQLQGVADRLEVRILQAEERGHDMTAARRHLEALRQNSRTAGGIGAKTGPMVLALSVEDYPDNKPVLERARKGLETARGHLAEAHRHARAIIAELQRADQG